MRQYRRSLLSLIAAIDRWQRMYGEKDDGSAEQAKSLLLQLSDKLAVKAVNNPNADPIKSVTGLWLCPVCGASFTKPELAKLCRDAHHNQQSA
ncbi:MAG: hypothetical protein DRI61_15280 [Chloroflexi bacterium]|nr:MAG: hypothetical protein DRI61_15280 [Chloroflexota bacterium]